MQPSENCQKARPKLDLPSRSIGPTIMGRKREETECRVGDLEFSDWKENNSHGQNKHEAMINFLQCRESIWT